MVRKASKRDCTYLNIERKLTDVGLNADPVDKLSSDPKIGQNRQNPGRDSYAGLQDPILCHARIERETSEVGGTPARRSITASRGTNHILVSILWLTRSTVV